MADMQHGLESQQFTALLASHRQSLQRCTPSTTDLLSHPLLTSSSLSSSATSLREQVNAFNARCLGSEQLRQQHQSTLTVALAKLTEAVRTRDQRLAHLPEQIGSVEDALSELCAQLTGSSPDVPDGNDIEDERGIVREHDVHLLQRLLEQQTLLTKMENVRDYLGVLARAEKLKQQAVEAQTNGESDEALTLLLELGDLTGVVDSRTSSKGVKASAFVHAQRNVAFAQLAKLREEHLAAQLNAAGWPPPPAELQLDATSADGTTTGKSLDEILLRSKVVRNAWRDLMLLQKKCEKLGILRPASARIPHDHEHESGSPAIAQALPGSDDYQPLLAVQCLLKPLLLRFYYHFDSSRSTNRLDKPEWYMSHMLSILRANASLFHPVHGAVAKLSNNTSTTHKHIRYDLSAELIHGLLRPLAAKLESSIPLLLQNTQLLSHTIMQAVQFDQDLRSLLMPVISSLVPIHLADTLLSNEAVFEAWVQSERAFASDRLNEELESGGAWLVGDEDGVEDEAAAGSWSAMAQDYNNPSLHVDTLQHEIGSTGSSVVKTTRSARAVISLIDGLTTRYRALSSISHQLPFLLIQLSVLQGYAQRLERSLDAFESLSSAFSRAIPGGMGGGGGGSGGDMQGISDSESDMVRGLRGLGRLLKACLSALYVAQHLSRLSTQSFFLVMGASLSTSREGTKLLGDFRKWEGEEEERELDQASLGELVRRGWRTGGRLASGMRPLTSGAGVARKVSPDPRVQQIDTLTPEDSQASAASSTAAPIDVWQKSRDRFEQLAMKAQSAIEKMVVSEVVDDMRSYAQRDWDEDEDDQQNDDDGVQDENDNGDAADVQDFDTLSNIPTSTLLPSLSTFSMLLSHLMPSLPRVQANSVYRTVSENLAMAIVDRAVFAGGAHRFSAKGAQRFANDVAHGWLGVVTDINGRLASSLPSVTYGVAATTAMGSRPQAPWKYVIDASVLLALTDHDDDEYENMDDTNKRTKPTLQQACRAAFEPTMAGPTWEEVVEMLSLDDRLSLRTAREILRRRTECAW